jgi:hypothetical protein
LIVVAVAAGRVLWLSVFTADAAAAAGAAAARVRQGDVIIRSFARGELPRFDRDVVGANLFGTVQVTRLAPLGSYAREKDLMVEFDDARY